MPDHNVPSPNLRTYPSKLTRPNPHNPILIRDNIIRILNKLYTHYP